MVKINNTLWSTYVLLENVVCFERHRQAAALYIVNFLLILKSHAFLPVRALLLGKNANKILPSATVKTVLKFHVHLADTLGCTECVSCNPTPSTLLKIVGNFEVAMFIILADSFSECSNYSFFRSLR